jgi:hypothetical protein
MIRDETPVSARFARKPVDRYTTGTRSASFLKDSEEKT